MPSSRPPSLPEVALRHSPLDAEHRALGARMVEFGGWEMPIQYGGVLEEHRACRERAVVFDVSHLGSVRVHGAGAFATLQWAFTNDLDRIGPGRAQYTHLLDPDDAHVVDDIIVWWTAPGDFLVMPNASNTAPLVDALREAAELHGGGECDVDDVTADARGARGPGARSAGAPRPGPARGGRGRAVPGRARPPTSRTERRAGSPAPATRARTASSCTCPRTRRRRCGGRCSTPGITPAGLGARDTLRLEAGLPLHGHELGPGITPLQAGLGWVVRFDKGDFRGRAALEAEKERGVARRLRGLVVEGRQIPREGYPVLRGSDAIGEVTSGNFSPVLEHGIALAFVPPDIAPGDAVTVDIRGRNVAAIVTKLPFVRR